ncbi:MAG: hypothetical protein DRG83_12330 [Deltaproteobacteria bacterium]|nr:MAG: hypothetical protein DRG83_12330 [Deltaproteobacteria bacterium]
MKTKRKIRRGILGGIFCIAFFIGAIALLWAPKEAIAGSSTPTFELKLQSHLTPHDMERCLLYFKRMVEKLTHGQIKVKLYPVGTLVPAKEMLNALRAGTLDIVHYAEGYFAGQVPGSEVASGLPLAFNGIEENWFFMWKRGLVDIMREEYAKHNAYFIPWEPWPTALMTKKPINRLEDLKGMKLRSYGGIASWLRKCGASVVFIPGGELYTALATGVVDGAHWDGAGPEYVMKFHEILKYFMQPYIQFSWNNLLVNMDVWKKFTPEQKIAFETAAQASALFSTMHTRMLERRALKRMVSDWGVKVVWLPQEDIAKAKELAIKAWDEIAKKNPRNAQIVKMLKDFVKEKELCDTVKKFPW